jgi:hypothetical protein
MQAKFFLRGAPFYNNQGNSLAEQCLIGNKYRKYKGHSKSRHITLMLSTGLAGMEKFADTIPKPCSSFEPTIHIRSTLSDATQ